MAAALLPPSVRRRGLSRAVHEAIFQHADAADLAAHDIAVAEVARRLEADADTGGRASRDHIAGQQGDAGRHRRDDCGNVEEQPAWLAWLARLTVTHGIICRDGQGSHGGVHEPWASRRYRVQGRSKT